MDNFLLGFSSILENLDLILISLFIAFIIWGAIRGMFKQLVGSISTMVAIIFSALFCKALYTAIVKLPIFDTMYYNWVFNFSNKTFPALSEISANDIPEAVANLPLISAVKESILNYTANDTGLKINLNVYIAQAITNYTALAFSFLLLFFLIKTLFVLLKKFAESLREYTPIRRVDGILGAIIGAFGLFRRLSFILFVINIIPFSFLDNLKMAISESVIANFITNHNIVEWILSLLIV